MPRPNRRSYEPPADNAARRNNAIGIAAVVLAALALWQWSQRHPSSVSPPPAPPVTQPTFVRLHK